MWLRNNPPPPSYQILGPHKACPTSLFEHITNSDLISGKLSWTRWVRHLCWCRVKRIRNTFLVQILASSDLFRPTSSWASSTTQNGNCERMGFFETYVQYSLEEMSCYVAFSFIFIIYSVVLTSGKGSQDPMDLTRCQRQKSGLLPEIGSRSPIPLLS